MVLFLYRMASSIVARLARPLLFVLAAKEGFFAQKSWKKEDLKKGLEEPLRRARELCAIETQTHAQSQEGCARRYSRAAPLLWLHGVDIGEAQVALTLAQDLWQRRAFLRVLITTTSRPAATLIVRHARRETHEDRLQHQFAPLDCRAWWRRFLHRWQPSLAVRCENEFWPNSIIETRQYCPLLFVQAKMSEKSFRRWQAVSNLALSATNGIAQRTMSNIDLALCQDEASARFLRRLGIKQTRMAGNLKSLPAPCSVNKETERWFASLLAQKKLWIAASTHAHEESSVIEAHRRLRASHPDALCIVAPRNIDRVPAIARRLSEQGEKCHLRSQQLSSLTAPFFLLDSFLELNSLYRWAKAVFVGGTLIDKGGHNFFEPARHGCRILHGPHLRNTHATLLQILHLTQEVGNACDLASCLQQEFSSSVDEKRKEKAQKTIESYHETLRANVLQSLEPYLKRLDPSPRRHA